MRYYIDLDAFRRLRGRQPRVIIFVSILFLPLFAVSQVIGVVPMQKDHKAVLISGYAMGSAEGSSTSSISLNGVEFTINTHFPADSSRHEIGSPWATCNGFREQIANFTAGVTAIPEFEAACIAVAGDAALLLVQANTRKYLVPSTEDEDDETSRWIKAKRRFIFISASTTDQSQKLKIVK